MVRILAVLFVILSAFAAGCGRPASAVQAEQATAGSTDLGRHLLYSYGCGSCHVIPGVAEARGTVGPPLDGFGNRLYIAGSLQNTPNNLFRWIAQPQEVEPGNAMPDLGVTEDQARQMAAYLYTLR